MMRLLLSPDGSRAVWRHKLDSTQGGEFEGWRDCTDMTDAQYAAAVCSRLDYCSDYRCVGDCGLPHNQREFKDAVRQYVGAEGWRK